MSRELEDEVARIRAVEDPMRRAAACGPPIERYRRLTNELAAIRRDAVQQVSALGLSYEQIAIRLGVTRARVHQIINGNRNKKG